MIGWMGMPDKDDEYPTAELGWQYSLTMPRELRLRQGHIYSRPAREMKDLRIAETAVELDVENTTEISRPLFDGSEILLDMELGESREIVVTVAFGTEKLRFIYDRNEQVMSIDRNEMKKGGRGVRRFKLFSDESLSMQLFVDKTAVEVFFQHGEEAASILVFPEKNIQPELMVAADGEIKSLSGKIWELDSFQFNS
jgi:beta-fructofuranosidase